MTLQTNHSPPDVLLGRYRHYKGGEYELLGVAHHVDTEERMVVYRCLYGNYDLWVRPYTDFVDSVELSGEMIPRFAYIGPPATDMTFNDGGR